ncbi:MAG: BatA domain-containing protein [Planctomycetaceae bacterium]|nr:BatA domain-containing protein [Planctomycetaceae bacterium]
MDKKIDPQITQIKKIILILKSKSLIPNKKNTVSGYTSYTNEFLARFSGIIVTFIIMSFITFSIFLGGILFAVAPVILHFLMRGKPKRVEFPALVFIKKNLEVNRRSYRLRHIFLLVLRVGVILLFGLALSRPSLKYVDWLSWAPNFFTGSNNVQGGSPNFRNDNYWVNLGAQDAPVAAAIVIDASLRMNYVAENQSRFDVAKQFAQWILKRIPSKSEIAILSTAREAAVFQIDMLAAKDKIERMQPISSGRAVAGVAADAINLLAGSKNGQRELYILTDLSEAGWSDKLAGTLTKLVSNLREQKIQNNNSKDKNKKGDGDDVESVAGRQSFFGDGKWLEIFVIDVGVLSPADAAIMNLRLSSQAVSSNVPIELEVEVSNIGRGGVRTVDLVLFDEFGGGESIRDTKTVNFPEGESRRSVSFSVAGFSGGVHQGRVQFTVPDALEFDDRVYFTLQVLPPLRILVVSDVSAGATSLFVRQALATVPFEVESISFSELLGKTAAELGQYNALMLLDPLVLDVVVWKRLYDYVLAGGGVGVFLGSNAASVAAFNETEAAAEIIGAKLVRHSRGFDNELWIMPSNKSNPVLLPFNQYGELDNFPWDAQLVFRYWELSDLLSRADIALKFTDGRPALITQMLGRGRAATLTTPVSETTEVENRWNILPVNDASWMFVLFIEGVAKYLTGVADRRFNYNAGEPVTLRPPVENMPETALLGRPDGKSVRIMPDVTKREINVTEVTEAGNYRIRSGGAKESLNTGFSINYDGNETNLRKIDNTTLDNFFGKGNYHLVKTPEEIEQKTTRRRIGIELYAIIIILMTTIFVTEYIFANKIRG